MNSSKSDDSSQDEKIPALAKTIFIDIHMGKYLVVPKARKKFTQLDIGKSFVRVYPYIHSSRTADYSFIPESTIKSSNEEKMVLSEITDENRI